MANFIVLGNWTEQGIKNVTEVPERVKTARKMIEKAGGKMQFFTTMGKYDFVLLVEIPKDEDMAAILLCDRQHGKHPHDNNEGLDRGRSHQTAHGTPPLA